MFVAVITHVKRIQYVVRAIEQRIQAADEAQHMRYACTFTTLSKRILDALIAHSMRRLLPTAVGGIRYAVSTLAQKCLHSPGGRPPPPDR
jgi:hypothetical protein